MLHVEEQLAISKQISQNTLDTEVGILGLFQAATLIARTMRLFVLSRGFVHVQEKRVSIETRAIQSRPETCSLLRLFIETRNHFEALFVRPYEECISHVMRMQLWGLRRQLV
jgi:hypothetical protein